MKVLFDSCVYDLRNKGNVAMLQTAINRVHGFWPDATLEVITSAPFLLRLYCPEARPITPYGVDYWSENRSLSSRIFQKLPASILRILFELREALWQHPPKNLIRPLASIRPSGRIQQSVALEAPQQDRGNPQNLVDLKALGIDLFIGTGGHYLTDIMDYDLLSFLERLEQAIELGIPTILVGQGIGPLDDPTIHAKARAVLPKVDLILLREYLEAPKILADFGVDPSRVIVTGDDAIEMAYQNYSPKKGINIGVGFRVAHTTEATAAHMEVLRAALQHATAKYKCQLIGLPVSQSAHELDQIIIEKVFTGSPYRQDYFQRLCRPEKLIKDTTLCRVVVTGTYHTAVFALSQGIPAIGLVQSASYINKFEGLADQFKGGMEVLRLEDEALYDNLIAAIDRAWDQTEEIAISLLQDSKRQIALGKSGYNRLFQVANAGRAEAGKAK